MEGFHTSPTSNERHITGYSFDYLKQIESYINHHPSLAPHFNYSIINLYPKGYKTHHIQGVTNHLEFLTCRDSNYTALYFQ
jgi:hypothetical protein